MTATTSLAPPRTHWSGTATDAELARWDAVAEAVAETLGADALARDRANAQPFAEARLLQDAALTTLLDPVEFGGGGAHWETAARVVRIIARRDASIAQLLGYHYINEANIALVAAPAGALVPLLDRRPLDLGRLGQPGGSEPDAHGGRRRLPPRRLQAVLHRVGSR